jgi:subtilase family serine protease
MIASVRRGTCVAALLAVIALAACSGGNSTPVAPVAAVLPSSPNQSFGSTSAVPYGAEMLAGATYVARAKMQSVGLDVLLTMRDRPGLLQYAKDANDPRNGLYRHWLTPQELADRFGASQSDYTAAAKYFARNGIAYKAYAQRQILRIVGPQANVERALGTQFGLYRKNGQTFVAPAVAPRPPASLRIAALGNAIGYRTTSRRFLTLRASTAFIEGFAPQQLANVFDYTGAYGAGYKGDGVTIGVIGTGPITDGDPRIAGGDVAEYRTMFGVTGTGTVVQDVDTMSYSPGNTTGGPGDEYSQTGLATPPPVTSPSSPGCAAQNYPTDPVSDYTTCNPEDIEAQLDTEQTAALAPDATVNFYIAYNPDECYGPCSAPGVSPSQQLGLVESDDETQQAINDNKSDVITMSFGGDEASSEGGSQYSIAPGYFGPGTNNFGPVEFASLVSEGIAVFASSGDNGAEACSESALEDQPCVTYPATDPSVVSVGGVNTPLDDSGRLLGPITGWGTQTQIPGQQAGASGGGCSIYFSAPSFETSIAATLCGGMRTQPDVALDADTNTGAAVVVDAAPSLGGRQIYAVGGTSVATPEMAAMWALVLQACKQSASCSAHGSGSKPYRLGNPNPYLYEIYANATQYTASFYDVLFGNNAVPNSSGNGNLDPGYVAGKGYDLVTGIGVPFARSLIASVLADVP